MRIEVAGVVGGYGKSEILHGLDFELPDRSVTVFCGVNGSGKSTLLKVLARLLRPGSGEVLCDGRNIWRITGREFARKVAYLPQNLTLPHEVTVERLVAFGRYPHRGFWRRGWTNDDYTVIERVLALSNLTGLRRRLVSTLSGGERQRCWIAMTLAQEPELLLLDEPTTFLDIACQGQVLQLIKELNSKLNITVAAVLHDLNVAASLAGRIIALKDGRIIFNALSPGEFMEERVLTAVYGAKLHVAEVHNFGKIVLPYQ